MTNPNNLPENGLKQNNKRRRRKPNYFEWKQALEKLYPGQLVYQSTQLECPCPGCGTGTDRLSVNKFDHSIYCRGCEPDGTERGRKAYWKILVNAGLQNLWEEDAATGSVMQILQTAQTRSGPDYDLKSTETSANAFKLLHCGYSKPLKGTSAEKRLNKRCIFKGYEFLKYNNGVYVRVNGILLKLPCMLGKVEDPSTGEFMGVHRTFITLEKEDKNRRFMGKCSGGGIRLSGEISDEMLIVAEGIEDALAIIQSGIKGAVWAAGSALNMPAFNVGSHVKYIIIAADGDEAGWNAAKKLADNCKKKGIRGTRIRPPEAYKDWNDLLMAGKSEFIASKMQFPDLASLNC